MTVRSASVLVLMVVLLSGCAAPSDQPPAESDVEGPDGLPKISAGPGTSAPSGSTGSGVPILHRLAPWGESDGIVVFDGRAPVSPCPEEMYGEEAALDELLGPVCSLMSLPDEARVPPGTGALSLTLTDAAGAMPPGCPALPSCGVVSALLVSHRSVAFEGRQKSTAPYEWSWELTDERVRNGTWNLPDHAVSGYAVRITSGQPAPPDEITEPVEGATVGVTIRAARDPDWRPIDVPDAYQLEDRFAIAPGVRLMFDAAVTLQARAGMTREVTPIDALPGVYLPVGTEEVVIVTRWSRPAECPAESRCIPWLYVVNGALKHSMASDVAVASGDGWAIYTLIPNLPGSWMWSELGPWSDNGIALDLVQCVETGSDHCEWPKEAPYAMDMDLDAIVNVETWNRTADLDEVKARYGLEN